MSRWPLLSLVIILLQFSLDSAQGEDGTFYLKAAKNVPRIGRSNSNKNTNIDQMGKFFMKASKSVPRIGRRNEGQSFDYGMVMEKRDQLPIWSDIADRFEYEPELLTSPEMLRRLEMGDDPSVYYQNLRQKRGANGNRST